MGMMHSSAHGAIAEKFHQIFARGGSENEMDFRDDLNGIVKDVELDDGYSTNQKLKIYELLSQIDNCMPDERQKYAKKIEKLLR